MDQARAAGALSPYADQSIGEPVVPPPRVARGRPDLRWVGIGGCVLVVCALLVSWLVWPQPAQLWGRWLGADQSRAAARADAVAPESPRTARPGAADG
jgi:hypothetical protein